jgi:hypothetical protein
MTLFSLGEVGKSIEILLFSKMTKKTISKVSILKKRQKRT